jgi:hypothetical protein
MNMGYHGCGNTSILTDSVSSAKLFRLSSWRTNHGTKRNSPPPTEQVTLRRTECSSLIASSHSLKHSLGAISEKRRAEPIKVRDETIFQSQMQLIEEYNH